VGGRPDREGTEVVAVVENTPMVIVVAAAVMNGRMGKKMRRGKGRKKMGKKMRRGRGRKKMGKKMRMGRNLRMGKKMRMGRKMGTKKRRTSRQA